MWALLLVEKDGRLAIQMKKCIKCGEEKEKKRIQYVGPTCNNCYVKGLYRIRNPFVRQRSRKENYDYWQEIELCVYRAFSMIEVDEKTSCWIFHGTRNEMGYAKINFMGKIKRAARIICAYFNGEHDEGSFITMHECDNPSCINPDHLKVGTRSQNCKDAYKRKRRSPIMMLGENHPNSLLKAKDVFKIRELVKNGVNYKKIAAEFKIKPHTVYDIKHRRSWGHL